MKKFNCKKEYLFVAFGVGCIVCCCMPAAWIMRVLAFVVIILGIMLCCRR